MRALILAIALIGCTRTAAPGAMDAATTVVGTLDLGVAPTVLTIPDPSGPGGSLTLGFKTPAGPHGPIIRPGKGRQGAPDGDLALERNGRDMLRWVGAQDSAPMIDGALVSQDVAALQAGLWLRQAVPTCPPLRFSTPAGRDLLVLKGACDDAGRLLRFLFLHADPAAGLFHIAADTMPGMVRDAR